MAKLAINGGTPVAPDGMGSQWPIFGKLEEKYLLESLRSGAWCCMGWDGSMAARAARKFAEFIGTKYAMTVPTGTAALEVAMRACDVGPGDEVIVPAVTFLASASAVSLTGAEPVFVDVVRETCQIDPDAVEAAITRRTKAIEPVHYGGYPADMDRIMKIARKHKLRVIEDACEAHGTEWRGKKVGSIGDMGCFSFQMGKPCTCGEGGGITFDDEKLRFNCYAHVHLGRTETGAKYEHYVAAGNHRMSEFPAAVLLAQLSRLQKQTDTRHANAEYFADELEKIGGLIPMKRDRRITKIGYYFYLLRYDASQWNGIHRNRFMKALSAEGVWCHTAHNEPLYTLTAYKNNPKHAKVRCPVAEDVYQNEVVSMSKDFLMKKSLVNKALRAIKKIKDNLDELKA